VKVHGLASREANVHLICPLILKGCEKIGVSRPSGDISKVLELRSLIGIRQRVLKVKGNDLGFSWPAVTRKKVPL
jgi:hypothetical protein